jgi:hypothetical protein
VKCAQCEKAEETLPVCLLGELNAKNCTGMDEILKKSENHVQAVDYYPLKYSNSLLFCN